MLNQDFCYFLEDAISKAFKNSKNEVLKSFWCDGVLLPNLENQYSKKYLNDNRKVILTVFIGNTGQEKYELTLNFGKKALSKYAKDLDILECLPDREEFFLKIDLIKHKLIIQLD